MFLSMTIISGLFFLQFAPAIFTFKTTNRSVTAFRSSIESACSGKEAGKFVKNPYACDKFFYCGSDETAFVVDCPHGMIFNDEREICDFPTNYLCVPRVKEDEEGVLTSTTFAETQPTASTHNKKEESSFKPSSQLPTSPLTITTMTTKKTTTTMMLPVENKDCPLHDTKTIQFLQHPHSCHRYFICYHGVPIVQECISELHWNPKTNRCDFPENSGCLVPTVVVPSTTAISAVEVISCPFRGEQIFPHPGHCNYFIYCINGYATVQQCPFFHHFDVRWRRCLWQTVATCMLKKK